MQSTFKGVQFLVEGEDDSRFWTLRVADGNVAIVICEGKYNLIQTISQVITLGLPNVIGIYDRDFDRLQGINHASDILTATDENDLEITLLLSKAMDVFLFEYADANLIQAFEALKAIPVLQHLENIATHFGRLRYVNHMERHGVNFDSLSPYRFVSVDQWELDIGSLKNEYASLAAISTSDLDRLLGMHCPPAGAWVYCQGHDTMCILAQGIKRVLSSRQINDKDLMRILRIAFDSNMLSRTSMYRDLCLMETRLAIPVFCQH